MPRKSKNNTQTHIVIGYGQIGKAVFKTLKDGYKNVYSFDLANINDPQMELSEGMVFDVIHICFGYSEKFIDEVRAYAKNWLRPGGLIIIHSTVPIGTSDKLGAVHSPVRGIHPNLYEGVKTFVKFFGGKRATEAAEIFRGCKVIPWISSSAKSVEAMKLWDTTQYYVNIVLEKIIHRFCEENGLDFDIVYTKANKSYNEGYQKLGHPEYKKYVLTHMPGKIGGHCVMQNLPLLNVKEITQFIVDF